MLVTKMSTPTMLTAKYQTRSPFGVAVKGWGGGLEFQGDAVTSVLNIVRGTGILQRGSTVSTGGTVSDIGQPSPWERAVCVCDSRDDVSLPILPMGWVVAAGGLRPGQSQF